VDDALHHISPGSRGYFPEEVAGLQFAPKFQFAAEKAALSRTVEDMGHIGQYPMNFGMGFEDGREQSAVATPNIHDATPCAEIVYVRYEAYLYAGQVHRGIELLERCRSLASVDGWYTATLAYAYCRTGQREKAEEILRNLERKSRTQYVAFSVLAFTSAAVGEVDRAFGYFRKSVADRDPILYFLATERLLDPIRNDARYGELLASMNIPTIAASTSDG